MLWSELTGHLLNIPSTLYFVFRAWLMLSLLQPVLASCCNCYRISCLQCGQVKPGTMVPLPRIYSTRCSALCMRIMVNCFPSKLAASKTFVFTMDLVLKWLDQNKMLHTTRGHSKTNVFKRDNYFMQHSKTKKWAVNWNMIKKRTDNTPCRCGKFFEDFYFFPLAFRSVFHITHTRLCVKLWGYEETMI